MIQYVVPAESTGLSKEVAVRIERELVGVREKLSITEPGEPEESEAKSSVTASVPLTQKAPTRIVDRAAVSDG